MKSKFIGISTCWLIISMLILNPGCKEYKDCIVEFTPTDNPWYVYDEDPSFALPSLFMGENNGSSLRIEMYSTENPYRGSHCIKVIYDASESWAGAFFPASGDWGVVTGKGIDLSGYNFLGFYARSANGNYILDKIAIGDKDTDTVFADLATDIQLTPIWQYYSYDLSRYDLSCVNGLMHFYVIAANGPGTFYIDDVQYRK